VFVAVSWMFLLWKLLSARVVDGREASTRRLMVLPLFAFPWIATDFERIGWWFRLSGAGAVERVLAAADVNVARNGTFLLVDGFQLSVEPACSGLNGLQSMLIAGTMLAFIALRQSPLYWLGLLALPIAAWLANFFRILSGAVVAVVMEPERAARWIGPLHSVAGWVALCVMFAMCWVLFARLGRANVSTWKEARRWMRNAPWLETAILGYAGWRCHALLDSWFTTPFDHLGWLAFALWILPIGIHAQTGALPYAGSGKRRSWLLGAGVILICLGDVGALNACKHLGLALIFIGFAPRAGRTLWALAAISWMPALGWLASRFGIDPDAAGMGRAVIALSSCAWALVTRDAGERTRDLSYVGSVNSTS
jgi:exosortase/archaeosortase family protein